MDDDCSTPVIFISMPFGSPFVPNLGLSLLKATLGKNGINSDIAYFNIKYANYVDLNTYIRVCNFYPDSNSLVGEWVFSHTISNNKIDSNYLFDILNPAYGASEEIKEEFDLFKKDALKLAEVSSLFLRQCAKEIIRINPKIVGFSSTFQQNSASISLAKIIKRIKPDITIIFGGANCEGEMGRQLLSSFPYIDYVVSGAAEKIITPLIRNILSGVIFFQLPGVYHRLNYDKRSSTSELISCDIDLDDLPFPDYDDYFSDFEHNKLLVSSKISPQILLETSRGCWWGYKNHCTFCGLNSESIKFREKSSDRAFQEIIYFARKYPGYKIQMVDNILPKEYFKSLLPKLSKVENKPELFYEVRANLSKENLRIIRQANVTEVQPGIESLSTHTLKLINKGVSSIRNIQFLKYCKLYNVQPCWNIIFGFPGELSSSLDEIIELIPKVSHLPPPNTPGPIRLDRFSPYHCYPESYGIKNIKPAASYSYIYPMLTSNQLMRMAYYFEFDNPNPSHKDKELEIINLAKDWKATEMFRMLLGIEKEDGLIIFDTREPSNPIAYNVSGIAKEILVRTRSIISIKSLSVSLGLLYSDYSPSLDVLIRKKLIHVEGKQLLSLVIDNSKTTVQEIGGLSLLSNNKIKTYSIK